ncbi:hypothetical protein [Mucilaginibacter sp. UYCu711]
MNATDLDNQKIAVTNLGLALLQAEDHRHYQVTSPNESDFQQ